MKRKGSIRSAWGLVLVLLVALTGCRSPSLRPGSEPPILPPAASYLRVSNKNEQRRDLQIALRRFSPQHGRGPSLWLVGVSHIGEASYYQTLQQLLETNRVVLFEGVGLKTSGDGGRSRASGPGKSVSRPSAQDPLRRDALDHSLQGTLARSLGLVFQLTAIDYSRPHFRNSDLTRADLERLISGPEPEKPASKQASIDHSSNEAEEQFAILMQAMEEGSWLNSMAKFLLGFIESSPQMRGLARLAMIEMLGGVGGDFESLARVNPGIQGLLEVLVQARNAKVMEDLSSWLRRRHPPASIAIFYGAAHMKDFESRLRESFHYVAREEVWLTAFGVDFQQSGIGTAERAMIRSMIEWQLEALKESR